MRSLTPQDHRRDCLDTRNYHRYGNRSRCLELQPSRLGHYRLVRRHVIRQHGQSPEVDQYDQSTNSGAQFYGKRSPAGRAQKKRNNPMAATGFVLGIVSIFLYFIGILPILAIVFSAIGLGTFKQELQKNKWMAGVGLALGIIYTLMYMRAYGHL